MDYRIIAFQNNQYWLKPGDSFTVNGHLLTQGSTVTAKTLLTSVAGQITIGTPYLNPDTSLTVTHYLQSPKIQVATYRAKSRYRKVRGHRQAQTVLKFEPATKSAPKIAKSKRSVASKPTKKSTA